MKTISPSDGSQNEITLRDILVHIQGLGLRMDSFEKKMERMDGRLDGIEKKLMRVEEDVRDIKVDISFMKSGIQNLDERLDSIELIPSILKHIKFR